MADDIFDSSYVGEKTDTTSDKQGSSIKRFLKEPVDKKDMDKYGTSKPRRVVIKARIKNG